MPSYEVELHQRAKRELKAMPPEPRERLTDCLTEASEQREPTRHPNVKQLSGQGGLFRVRIDRWRAIAERVDDALLVYAVGRRERIYGLLDDGGIGGRRVSQ